MKKILYFCAVWVRLVVFRPEPEKGIRRASGTVPATVRSFKREKFLLPRRKLEGLLFGTKSGNLP